MMKLSEKIVKLRKMNGWSQEAVAEKLNISRQAISRWEGGTAQPDASNILQLSKLFEVSTDYLLNDEYEGNDDLPRAGEAKKDNLKQVMIIMTALEVMIWILQFIAFVILQSDLYGVLCFIPFVAVIGCFEYAYRKNGSKDSKADKRICRRLYVISVWLGTFFPVQFILTKLSALYPRPYSSFVFGFITLAVYIAAAILLTRLTDKRKS